MPLLWLAVMILFFLKNYINAIARSNKLETHSETAGEEFVVFFPLLSWTQKVTVM